MKLNKFHLTEIKSVESKHTRFGKAKTRVLPYHKLVGQYNFDRLGIIIKGIGKLLVLDLVEGHCDTSLATLS